MIQVFTTGGTIDKDYFDAKSDYEVGDAQVDDILRAAGVEVPWRLETLMRKDSLDIDDADRAEIAERVAASEARRVLVSHGTDTMAQTARAIADRLGRAPGKTVVLVGSLTPARFRVTDAPFNVGFALAAVQTLPAGVYVAMNGRAFPAHSVRKNRERNRFERIDVPEADPLS